MEAYKMQKQDAFTGKLSFALRTKTINLKEILIQNVQGKAVLQSYKKTKYLSRKNRMLIVDVILTDLLNEIAVYVQLAFIFLIDARDIFNYSRIRLYLRFIFRLTNYDFVYLSEQIIKLFPTENLAAYFILPVPK